MRDHHVYRNLIPTLRIQSSLQAPFSCLLQKMEGKAPQTQLQWWPNLLNFHFHNVWGANLWPEMLALLIFFFFKESNTCYFYNPIVCFFLNFLTFFLLQNNCFDKRKGRRTSRYTLSYNLQSDSQRKSFWTIKTNHWALLFLQFEFISFGFPIGCRSEGHG